MLVDTHVHVEPKSVEQVEALLSLMQANGVDKATLVKRGTSADNDYIFECLQRYPGRFSAVCRVDTHSSHALDDLEQLRSRGAESLRLKNSDRSPGRDPLAIWKKAQELGMSVSVSGNAQTFASAEFASIVKELPDLKFVLEHLAGMGLFSIAQVVRATGATRPKPTDADYRGALNLANYPNTYIKTGGMGEICLPPIPYETIPPYVQMAYDAFGAHRLMWGSDWPPVARREGYRDALRFTREHLTFCSEEDREWIFGKTALSIWKFP